MSGRSGRRKACSKPGCPTVHDNSGAYCDEHRPAVLEERPNSAQRGYDADWKREREAYLLAHPWCMCESCRGSKRPRRSEVVDHIIPHRGDQALFWDRSNWQAMAKRCHDRKTAGQDGGFGRQ